MANKHRILRSLSRFVNCVLVFAIILPSLLYIIKAYANNSGDLSEMNASISASLPKGITWGRTIDQWKISTDNWDFNGITTDASDLQQAGITWARIGIKYGEPYHNFDTLLQIANNHNINTLFLVKKNDPVNDLGDDTQRAAYKTWLSATVNYFKDRVHYWEIGNEPNLPPSWNIDTADGSDPAVYSLSVANYITHLRDSYETIKSVDPSAIVLNGGLSEYKVERYLNEFIAQNAQQYFDVFSYHPYADNPDKVIARLGAVTNIMAPYPGWSSKPIWISEVGFQNGSLPNNCCKVTSETKRADYLQLTMQKLADAGVENAFWYDYAENLSQPSLIGFGLVSKNKTTYETTHHAPYDAYQDLWSSTFLSILNPDADAYVSDSNPNTNYGAASPLVVSGSSKVAYLKFSVPLLTGYALTDSKLRIFTNAAASDSGSSAVQQLRLVGDSSWSESTITFNNRPVSNEGILGTLTSTQSGQWYEIPIDIAVLAQFSGQSVTFAIDASEADNFKFNSKEGNSYTKPQLVLYMTPDNSSPTETPTPTKTSTPTPRPRPTASPTPTTGPDIVKPLVNINSPLNGSRITINSQIMITAEATDNVSVAFVKFYINNNLITTDNSAPYNATWNVPSQAGKIYKIKARAVDPSGNRSETTIVVTSTR